jgi:sugar phosphate isomerase/epimerase
MFTIGTVEDRYSHVSPWTDQLRATVRLVQSLAPLLRDLGARLCLKTHEEITSFEVLNMIEQVGPELLSVCFDPANVLVRIEAPLASARRLLPFIRQIQLDDAVVAFAPPGLERWLYPVGGGIVDWAALFGLLETQDVAYQYTIELHRAFFDMPIFDAAWLAARPDLTPAELASVIRLAQASRGVTDGRHFKTRRTPAWHQPSRISDRVRRLQAANGIDTVVATVWGTNTASANGASSTNHAPSA